MNVKRMSIDFLGVGRHHPAGTAHQLLGGTHGKRCYIRQRGTPVIRKPSPSFSARADGFLSEEGNQAVENAKD